MSASLETLVVAAYMFADDAAVPRSGPDGLTTDAELVALAVAQAAIGIVSDRQFLGLIAKLLPGWFPHLPCQSQYNRRLRRLAPLLAAVQLRIASLLARGELRLADGTLIGVANYPGCQSRSEFAAAPPTATARPRASTSGECGSSWSPTGSDCRSATRSSRPTKRSTSRCVS